MSGDQGRDTGESRARSRDGDTTPPGGETDVGARGAGRIEERAERRGRGHGVPSHSKSPVREDLQRELLDLRRSLRQAEEYVVTIEGMLAGGDAQVRGGWDDCDDVDDWGTRATQRGGDRHPALERLTPSERESLALYGHGLSYAEIAHERGVQPCTVSEQLKSARAKLEATSTREAVKRARELGLIE